MVFVDQLITIHSTNAFRHTHTHRHRQARQSVFISTTIDTTGYCKTHTAEKREEAISVFVPGNVKQEQEKNRKNKLDTYKYSKCVKCVPVFSFPYFLSFDV